MLKSLLALLKRPSATSAELEAALAQIDPQPLEEQVEKLEGERRALLLKDGADKAIEDLEARIRDANRDIERLAVAKGKLQDRIERAKGDEHVALIERMGSDGRAAAEAMKSAYIELDAIVAGKVVPILDRLKQLEEELRACNKFVAENGRSDLKVKFPLQELGEHLGMNPQSLPTPALWSLHGYWPITAVAGGLGAITRAGAFPTDRRLEQFKSILRS